MRKNNKGFTLVELLAVIVVLAIVMGLAAVAITNVLENTRKAAMVSDAKSFLDGAHSLVNSSDLNTMIGGTSATNYAPSCNAPETKYIPLAALELEKGGKSPYGNQYLRGSSTTPITGTAAANEYTGITEESKQASYIKVTSDITNGKCTFSYEIYLTDGVYNIVGNSAGSSVAEASLTNDNVKLVPSGE